jgi:DNA repair exonuclease SbcCD ATPase subunit
MEGELTEEKNKHYATKKKYDFAVSRLNEEVMMLKTGMNDIEKDWKEKLENEKSMMMLTSRSLIKEAELKNNNAKFYEEELRKLRQLLEIQAQEVEDSERNVEEKIKMAEDELTRLSNKILEIKSEAEESEKKFRAIIHEKDEEIQRLNQLLNAPAEIRNEVDENAEIRKLEEIISEKEDQARTFRVRCEDLESEVRQLKAEIERLNIENQINSEDAKKHYKGISEKNLQEMRGFYDRRVRELEGDKAELARINSSQTEQITELVRKYKGLEEAMRELVRQARKRGDLEARIISLGMDNNLVKNMAELFHK